MIKKIIKPLIYIPLVTVFIIILWVAYPDIDATSTSAQTPAKKILNGPDPSDTLGFDWSLPINTPVEENAGLIGEYGGDPAYINNVLIMARWDKLNPFKNRFDFTSIDTNIKTAKKKKFLIRLEVNSACEAPKWVLKKLRVTKKKSLVYWDKSYQDLLTPLIRAFAQRYANHPQIIGVQLGIGDGEYNGSCNDFSNKDGWGEFWMTPEELSEAENQFDLTPSLFFKRSKEIIELYVNAFSSDVGKLAFTNAEPYFSWGNRAGPYNELMFKLADYAHQKGVGNRDGAVESWLRYVDRTFGMKFESMSDSTCRLEMDEKFAKDIQGRYWGTENEFYGNFDYVTEEFGPYRNQAYRFFVSSMRSLQMRRNFSSISGEAMKNLDDPVYKTQDFLKYLNKTMGKNMENTPDVFVLMGERYIAKYRVLNHKHISCFNGDRVAVRSFGRWLKDNSKSRPAIKINMPKEEEYWGQKYYLPEGIDYEYAARSSRHFGFDINNELINKRCSKGCNANIYVTYKDTESTKLQIGIAEGVTKNLLTKGDSKIHTAKFPIRSRFNNGVLGSDFTVLSSNKAIPILLVRMVFD